MKKLNHVYEVYTVDNGEDIIVDILRFANQKDAREFETGIVGDYKVRQLTMSAEELVDFLLDDIVDKEERIDKLECQIEDLKGALNVATLYINDINPGSKSSAKLKTRQAKGLKVFPFPVKNS
jgi:hypothetical protein